jgi:hypothetical protein
MYEAKITLKFDSTWEHTGGIYDDETLPEEHYTFEVPAQDLNATQLFTLFSNFARAIGHTEMGIMKGACAVAFNDMRSEEDMKKTADEFDLVMSEEHIKKMCELETEVRDLKAKLSRALNSSAEQYTEEEISAMCSENEVSIDTLKNADVVCSDCGSKYGHYSVGCSSHWMGTCNVCGQEKSITEVRDWNYLKEGIDKLSK